MEIIADHADRSRSSRLSQGESGVSARMRPVTPRIPNEALENLDGKSAEQTSGQRWRAQD